MMDYYFIMLKNKQKKHSKELWNLVQIKGNNEDPILSEVEQLRVHATMVNRYIVEQGLEL